MSLSRTELFARLGLIQVVERITKRAYEEREENLWRHDLENSPHGSPWHTSFHASSFPGDNPSACGREAVYGLLNVPEPAPASRFLRAVADAGKAIEEEHVKRWAEAGRLLSADVRSEFQTGFVDADHWLTGNTDALLLPFRWQRPHVVEVKSKAHDKVLEMKAGVRGPDPKHRLQAMTYIGLAHENADRWDSVMVNSQTWEIMTRYEVKTATDMTILDLELEPCMSGSIFYISRDDPSTTHEFYLTYDPDFLRQGRAKLAEWKRAFEDGQLPDRPREVDGKLVGWSVDPCRWCDYKKNVCKPDWKEEVTDLSESHAINFVKGIRPKYDYDATRKAVLDRWTQS